jgi:glycosyltransferase involved in cell wall biosynthesis
MGSVSGVELVGIAGRHRHAPTPGFEPPIPVAALPVGGALLYELSTRFNWPKIESVVHVDLVHATTIIPPATSLPMVATLHDVAFLRHPEFFTKHGNAIFRRSLDILRTRRAQILCSSQATVDDCLDAGFASEMLHHVPLGVIAQIVTDSDKIRVQQRYDLPGEFVLFVGTKEPRKNLSRLIDALSTLRDAPPLVVAGMDGWGDDGMSPAHDVRAIGFVPSADLPALYALSSVFAFPSVWEGYGLPVLEAMAHGAPVVTSRGTSTEEVAGGAAVLVDPLDVASIADGISRALAEADALRRMGRERANELPWARTAELTAEVYKSTLGGPP